MSQYRLHEQKPMQHGARHLLVNSVHKERICQDDGEPLEEQRSWAAVVQVTDIKHLLIKESGNMW